MSFSHLPAFSCLAFLIVLPTVSELIQSGKGRKRIRGLVSSRLVAAGCARSDGECSADDGLSGGSARAER